MAMARRTATTIRNNPSYSLSPHTYEKGRESPRSLPFFKSLPPCRAADTFLKAFFYRRETKNGRHNNATVRFRCICVPLVCFIVQASLVSALALHKRAILIRSLIPKILLFVFVLCRKSVNLNAKNASVPFSKSIFRINYGGALGFAQSLGVNKCLRIFL